MLALLFLQYCRFRLPVSSVATFSFLLGSVAPTQSLKAGRSQGSIPGPASSLFLPWFSPSQDMAVASTHLFKATMYQPSFILLLPSDLTLSFWEPVGSTSNVHLENGLFWNLLLSLYVVKLPIMASDVPANLFIIYKFIYIFFFLFCVGSSFYF